MKKSKKIVRYRKRIHINIGIIIFAFVLVYFLIYLISFLTANNISFYEVQQGQIAHNAAYTGLILRTEEVSYAESAGAVNYYKKESDKTGSNDLICSIDQTGEIAQEITQAGLDGTKLDEEGLASIQSYITDYTVSYSNMQFYNVYSFKDSVNAKIQEDLYTNALDALSEKTDSAVSQYTFSFIRSKTDGVLAFYTDGYENVTTENFKAEMYNPASYTKTNLKNNTTIASGQALYKNVTDEHWNLLIPIEDEDTARYQQELEEDEKTFVLYVHFKKDNTGIYTNAEIKNYDGQNFLLLTFHNSMIRFLSDRYVEVELGTASAAGLKIPNSSILEKEFLVIPKKYIGKGDNSTSNGVLKVSKDKHGKESIEFVSTDLYYETDDAYYIDEESLSVGDTIQLEGSSEQYVIKDTATREGVYNINKGYAVFRLIDVLAENEEYTIVRTGTNYGLSLYDHIALDGTSIREGALAN